MSGTGNGTTTVTASTNPGINGLLVGERWTDATIFYSFSLTSAPYSYTGTGNEALVAGFTTISAAQQLAIHFALNAEEGPAADAGFSVEGFTGLDIVSLGAFDSTTAEIRFAATSDPSLTTAQVADFPGSVNTTPLDDDGDVWFGTSSDYTNPVAGSYEWHTHLHEIGHALGLKHGHENSVGGPLPSNLDSMEYTVMTYRSYEGGGTSGYTNATWDYAQTYMMLDIAALQYMYGADFTTNSGDTIYSWAPDSGDTLINGVVAIAPGGNRIFATIWDGGGVDTYDLSAYITDVSINLAPGEYSVFSDVQLANLGDGHFAHGNIYNALQYTDPLGNVDARSLIENATGGSGNDTILGNVANNTLTGGGGDDRLTGGAGGDFLFGGDGRDIAYFSGPSTDYTIVETPTGFSISHLNGSGADGTDIVTDVECAVFSDRAISLNPITGPLDIVFLQDLTGSFGDDLPNMQNSVDDIASLLFAEYAGSRIAVTSFLDVGDPYVYRVESDFVTTSSAVSSIYNSLVLGNGGDFPEAQLTALASAATGTGLSYTEGHTRIFILATDASYHPYEDVATLAAQLAAEDIIPIFTVTPDNLTVYQDLVAQLGVGYVVTISNDSSDFADSIRYALADLSCEVTAAGDTGDNFLTGIANFIDVIFGLGGSDTISGLSGNDQLDGGSGNDFVDGGEGNDTAVGGSGEDVVTGGIGADTVNGNEGNDLLYGDSIPTYIGSGVLNDTALVGNYSVATARSIDGLFSQASNPDIQLSTTRPHVSISGAGNGNVRYYSFTVLTAGTVGTFDIDYSTAQLDSWISLFDSAGNQLTFDDDSGTAEGGTGSTSSLDSYLSYTFAAPGTYVIAVGEYSGLAPLVTGSDFTLQVSLTGPVVAPLSSTSSGSADILDGGDGDDTLIGGAAGDILRGGNGIDTASYASDTAAMNINLTTNTAQGGSSTGDTFNSIENVVGGSGNDTITGTTVANVLDGRNGNDALNGGNGNDTLNGGEGNDTLVGGGGADALNGGNGLDTASYTDQTANLNINLATSTAAGGSATGDTFNSIENVTGGTGNDTITGSTGNNVLNGGAGVDTINGGGGNDTIIGGDGNDSMNGGAGADSFNGGAGGDRVSYTDQSVVLVINLTSGTGSGGDAAGDTYTLVEHVAGGSGNDTITGNTGNNILDGNNGNDIINGGNGLDTINGGEGNDRISGGAGADTMNGGNGTDTILYNEQTAAIVVNLTTQTVSGGTTTGDTFSSMESILSGSGNDTLTGSSVNNVINGGGGNDSITGAGGNDLLTGSTGNDTFVYANGWGIDTITDFSTSDLEDINLAALTNITDFNDLITNHIRNTVVSGVSTLEIFDGTNVIRLTGYTTADIGVASAISANDFQF